MAKIELKGLDGLSGLSQLQRESWYNSNPKYKAASYAQADRAYRNQLFVAKYGEDAFKQYDYTTRDALYRNGLIEDTFVSTYGANAKALGNSKYKYMDPEAKLKLLESGYMPQLELLNYLDTTETHNFADYNVGEFMGMAGAGSAIGAAVGTTGAGVGAIPGYALGAAIGGGVDLAKQTVERLWGSIAGRKLNADEKKRVTMANLKLLDDIYSESAARALDNIDTAPYIESLNQQYQGKDELLDKDFNAIFDQLPLYKDNKDNIDGELDALTKGSNKASLQKEWLAYYQAASLNLPPEIAELALRDKLQNYVADNLGWWKQNVFLPGQQVAVTMEVKALQIATGLEQDALLGMDAATGLKFDVYMNGNGKIVPTKDVENGTIDPNSVKKVSLDRSQLHRMGVYTDGTPLAWGHNPQVINAMLTTNTFSPDAAVRYLEQGYSPYVPTNYVGEDENTVYATANMVGQFTFDAVAAYLTRGAARGTGAFAKGMGATKLGNALTKNASNIGMYSASIGGLEAIGEGYAQGHMEEALAQNLYDIDNHFYQQARQLVDAALNGDKSSYTNNYLLRVTNRIQLLLDASVKGVEVEGEYYEGPTISFEQAKNEAETLVLDEFYQERFNELKNSDEYNGALQTSLDATTKTATMIKYSEMAKYGYHYLYGYRNYFVSDKVLRQEKALENAQRGALFKRVLKNDKPRLEALKKPMEMGIGRFKTEISGTPAYIARSAWNNVIVGGGLSNYTDELVTGAARGLASAEVNAYLNNEYRGEALEDGLTFFDALDALSRGALDAATSERGWNAFKIGAIGSGAGFMPNVAAASSLLTKNGRDTWNSFGKGLNSEKVSFLFNNGFLGGWAQERALDKTVENWANVVNTMLDQNKDFDIIMDAIASDKIEAKDGISQELKTLIQAINSIALLENMLYQGGLPNAAVVKALELDVTNLLEDNLKLASGEFTQEDLSRYLAEYFSRNSTKNRTPESEAHAMQFMQLRALLFQEARKIYDEASELIQQLVQSQGGQISPYAAHKIVQRMTLNLFAETRLGQIEEQITGSQLIGKEHIAAVGGELNALMLTLFYEELKDNAHNRYDETLEALEEVENEIAEFENDLKGLFPWSKNTAPLKKERARLQRKKEAILLNGITKLELDAIDNNVARKSWLLEHSSKEDMYRLLSADEILHLSPAQRARMLNNPKMYSDVLLAQIAEAMNKLSTNPNAMNLVNLAAQLYHYVEDSKNALGYINSDVTRAAAQLDLATEITQQEVFETAVRRGVASLSSMIDLVEIDPTISTELKEEVVKDLLTKANPEIVKRLDYPQYQHTIDQYLKQFDIKEVMKAAVDAALGIGQLESDTLLDTNPDKAAIREEVKSVVNGSTSLNEAVDLLKDYLTKNKNLEKTNPLLYEAVDNTLQHFEELMSQRESTQPSKKEDTPTLEDLTALEEKAKQQAAEQAAKESVEANKQGTNVKLAGDLEDVDLGGTVTKETTTEETITNESEASLDNIPSEKTLVEESELDVDLGLIELVNTPTVIEEESKLPEGTVVTMPVTSTNSADIANNQDMSTSLLLGNPLYRYDLAELKVGRMELRESNQEGDLMDQFFKWCDNHRIKLLEIIDNELGAISALDPDVHFLLLKPQSSSDKMLNQPLLVVEYTSKVKRIHRDERGGVIEANGKLWLVIGASWSNSAMLSLYTNDMVTPMKVRRKQYLDANPTLQYYVDTLNTTKLANVAPGRLVTLKLGDESKQLRTLSDLINDAERNPYSYQLEDLAFGILVGEELKVVKVHDKNLVYNPVDKEGNQGAVFVLLPTANGRFLPAKIAPTMLKELRDGELKSEIANLLMQLTSPTYAERYGAITKLRDRLVLNDNNNISIGNRDKQTLSIIRDGQTIKSYDLTNSGFNPIDFVNDIQELLNPRIQIGLGTLLNSVTVKQYDDAGCLTTDVAMLGTVNASFSVYSVDADGKPIIEEPVIPTNNRIKDGDLSRKAAHSVQVQKQVYRERQGKFYDEHNSLITDPVLITHLEYNHLIESKGLVPVLDKGGYECYILDDSKTNPKAIKRHKDSHLVEAATKEASQKLIDKIAKEIAEKKRIEAAEENEKALAENNVELNGAEDVDLGLGIPNSKTIERVIEEQSMEGFEMTDAENVNLGEEVTPIQEVQQEEIPTVRSTLARSFEDRNSNLGPTTLAEVMKSEYSERLDDIIDAKIDSGAWEDVPDGVADLEQYFQSKGITTTGIGTTISLDQWFDMIENCK